MIKFFWVISRVGIDLWDIMYILNIERILFSEYIELFKEITWYCEIINSEQENPIQVNTVDI